MDLRLLVGSLILASITAYFVNYTSESFVTKGDLGSKLRELTNYVSINGDKLRIKEPAVLSVGESVSLGEDGLTLLTGDSLSSSRGKMILRGVDREKDSADLHHMSGGANTKMLRFYMG